MAPRAGVTVGVEGLDRAGIAGGSSKHSPSL